jgi:DNA polymerase epsilon subunit 1
MLNVMVAEHNTNDQFATLIDSQRHKYESSSEMTIEFEVDGPYRAMVLPASKEEGKLIKKRYAVFNFDGSLAELKGFELKRRGELKLIKVFQGEVFDQFLKGASLEECYGAVAAVGNRWLDLLDTRGVDVTDEELVEMISETCVMSKGLDEYDGRKSCAITCATRLAQFLGDGRVRDKGLVCHYVVAAHPRGQPTSERAIPVAIFSTEPSVARTFLRRWCGAEVNRGKIFFFSFLGNNLSIFQLDFFFRNVPSICIRCRIRETGLKSLWFLLAGYLLGNYPPRSV